MDVLRDSVTVVAIELDEFRDLASVVGVDGGDAVLRAVAAGIQSMLEAGCTPVRAGRGIFLCARTSVEHRAVRASSRPILRNEHPIGAWTF